MPNADTGGYALTKMIEEFVSQNENAKMFTSLGQLKYLSCISYVDGVVGNSSSGITEVPTFKKGTVNIGDRQLGRIQAASVINCEPIEKDIERAIEKLYAPNFKSGLAAVENPYGDGGSSARVVKVLKEASLEGIIKKTFHDL
jgi:GDP/UDP-N,N'-diacetylbacillosamine 2-epimerase (hydrolysing)